MHDTMAANVNVFSLISLGNMQEFGSCSFAINDFHDIVYPLPPMHEKVFSASMFVKLKMIYSQLYPGSTINHCSQFYHRFRRLNYASEIIGSGKNSKDGIIMAFWPIVWITLILLTVRLELYSIFSSILYVSLTQRRNDGTSFAMCCGSIHMNLISTLGSLLQ